MLVAMLGMTMRASASSGRTAKVISASAIGGRPIPIAPLAMPATMKAPAITSICVTVIAELYSGSVGEDLMHEARIGFTDQVQPVVGHASLPLIFLVILWVWGGGARAPRAGSAF